jgi:hypothetical protein
VWGSPEEDRQRGGEIRSMVLRQWHYSVCSRQCDHNSGTIPSIIDKVLRHRTSTKRDHPIAHFASKSSFRVIFWLAVFSIWGRYIIFRLCFTLNVHTFFSC